MPSGPDFTPTHRGTGGKKNANCSFCRKSYREVGPLVEGPDPEQLPVDHRGGDVVGGHSRQEGLAPCALGAIINDETLPKLRCKILAGATNNPLGERRHGEELVRRNILYAPDYVINAGGIINVSTELMPDGFNQEASLARIERIPKALSELWTIAKEENIAPNIASHRLAKNILATAATT